MGLCCGGKKPDNKDYGKGIPPLEKGKLPGKITVQKDVAVIAKPTGVDSKQAPVVKKDFLCEIWGNINDGQTLTALAFLSALK